MKYFHISLSLAHIKHLSTNRKYCMQRMSKKMTQSFFQLQSNFKVDYAPAKIKKWRSSRTGLQLTLIDQKSPIVNGYFAVATEILNDSGCPHTLEHLVFMGSKKYPYKGLLDVLGNLAFSSTNAWTATDQTVYTLTTAGWEGFKMLLPVYLDHLFNPTITDAACCTEVYHIDGEGKDKGVVYSEMQGIENQSWFIQGLETQRTLYKNSGYKSETGGLTKNLRTLENDTIRKYHADNYRPDNLCVIVTGSIEEDELLKLMINFDSTLQDLPEVPNKRPFVDTPQDAPLSNSVTKTVEFPDEDESASELMISWIGPDGRDSILDQAIDTLGKYFTSSSVSLFNKHFIEIEQPLATGADFYTDSYIRSGINISFNNVPTEKINELPDLVFKLMNEHCNPESLDIVRLRDLVEQTKWKFVFKAENSSESLATLAIFEFGYGNVNGKDLKDWAKTLKEFDEILLWDVDRWLKVYQKYFLDNKSCVVIAKPSKQLYEKSKIQNKKLIDDRKKILGQDGLQKLGEKLKKAQELNDKPIPKEIINSFGQPDLSSINFIQTESVAVGLNKDVLNDTTLPLTRKILDDVPVDFPLYMHFEITESNFCDIYLLFSSLEIDKKYMPLLEVFKTLTSLPIENDDGTLTSYEDVIKQLKRDTVQYSFSNSFCGAIAESLNFRITVKASDYHKAIDWYIKLLFKTKFTKERVHVALKKLVRSLPEYKRSGTTMLRSLINKKMYTDRSLLNSSDFLSHEKYLLDVLKQIESGEFETIEKQLNEMRNQVFKLSNTRVFVVGDADKIKKPVSSWSELIKASPAGSTDEIVSLPIQAETLSPEGLSKSKKCYVVTTPGSDSSYMNLVTNIPTNEYTSADAFKILLGAAYLQCVEGPFWRGIRGSGLAYGANCHNSFDIGQLSFSIYRGAEVEKCFAVAKDLVEGYASGKIEIDGKMRQGAVSAIVNELTESQSNGFQAAGKKIYDDVLVQRGPDYNSKLTEALKEITNDDLVEIFNKYFINLFDSKKSMCFISCNPAKADEIEKYFQSLGYETSVEHVTVDKDGDEEDNDFEDEEEELSGHDSESSYDSEFDTQSESELGDINYDFI